MNRKLLQLSRMSHFVADNKSRNFAIAQFPIPSLLLRGNRIRDVKHNFPRTILFLPDAHVAASLYDLSGGIVALRLIRPARVSKIAGTRYVSACWLPVWHSLSSRD